MIIIKYCGGLGNQMYQYALACVMKSLYPEQCVKADLNHYYLLKEHNGFELSTVFSINIDEASRREITKVYYGFVPYKIMQYLPIRIRKYLVYSFQTKYNQIMKVIKRKKKNFTISDLGFNIFNDVVLHMMPKVHFYFSGMWQNVNYFLKYEDLVKKEFQFRVELNNKEQELCTRIQENTSVSIHVRRGDFVGKKFDICNMEYYKKAIEYIGRKIDNPKFYIFTDDKIFVNKNFDFIEYEFTYDYSKEKNYMDLLFMSKCKHNIISNSTFSFWGAFLNENSDKVVIYPEFCIKDDIGSHEYSVPPNWKKINIID